METYICPLHKKEHKGVKREDFDNKLYDALLISPMDIAYKLYKEVKHGCHCPENYASLDKILKEGPSQE
jgi:hypothetical protein